MRLLLMFRLCQGLENSGGDGGGPGTVLATLRERFVAADSKKSGFLDGARFRAVLADLPGMEGLTVRAKYGVFPGKPWPRLCTDTQGCP